MTTLKSIMFLDKTLIGFGVEKSNSGPLAI